MIFQYLYTLLLMSIFLFWLWMVAICYVDTENFVINKTCHIIWCCVHFCDLFFHRIYSEQFFSLSPFNQNDFSFILLTGYMIFNGNLNLIFTKRNTCLYFIINFLSKPKIFSKDIQILNYFIHVTCEIGSKINSRTQESGCSWNLRSK